MKLLKRLFDWGKHHLILVTVVAMVSIVVMVYVNIQILHMTSEPEFCAMCHPKKGFGPLAEVDSWEHSGHGEAGVSCLDCHGRPGALGYIKAKLGGLKDTYMQLTISPEHKLEILKNPKKDLVPAETCLFCHSDKQNQEYRLSHKMEIVKMRLSDGVTNPAFRQSKGLPDVIRETSVGGTHFDHSFHIESFGLTCRDCHFGVVHQPQSKTARMNMCLACHAENRDSSAPQMADCTTCHETQVAMRDGKGAISVSGEPDVMTAAGVTCDQCHTGVAKGLFRPTAETCVQCHDASYTAPYEEWKKETAEALEKLTGERATIELALHKADAAHRDTKENWTIFNRAATNLRFIRNDGTSGVHNAEYAQAILKSVAADLAQIRKNLNMKW